MTFGEYLDYLEVHPEEFTALFNTILINVTGFLPRRRGLGGAARESCPALLRERPAGDRSGCGAPAAPRARRRTRLAMVPRRGAGREAFRERVKIYATDVDEEALAHARARRPTTRRELEGVPARAADRYFEPVNGGERLAFRKDLRRCVIFGRNNLVQDAPISRLDLLVCRNTLMYFNAETQARILRASTSRCATTACCSSARPRCCSTHASLFQAGGPQAPDLRARCRARARATGR